MASNFPKGPSIGPELGVGGSGRRMEGMSTGALFGHQLSRPPSPPAMKSNPGPTPGKVAFSAGIHQVMPHIYHSS